MEAFLTVVVIGSWVAYTLLGGLVRFAVEMTRRKR